MRALLQDLLAGLDIPAIHVTHDRDEALSIGDDLAVIVAGQLRQAGPASQVAAAPADRDAARLLGWSELGPGTATHRIVRAGQLLLPDTAPPGTQGPVQIFCRPEDVLLRTPAPDAPAGASLTALIQRIVLTRPLARISLASDPPMTALVLHRDLERLHMQAGASIEATLPTGSVRIVPAT
jgi:molybdate transport system ATP-binding protein